VWYRVAVLSTLAAALHPDPSECSSNEVCEEGQVEEYEDALAQIMRFNLLQLDTQAVKTGHQGEEADEIVLQTEKSDAGDFPASPTSTVAKGLVFGLPSWPGGPQSGHVHSELGPTVHEAGHSRSENYKMQACIPIGAFLVGGIVLAAGRRTLGFLAVYFGAQAGFSLYMKIVLSNAIVSKELHYKGVPAAFMVTAVQQIVALFVLAFVLLVLRCIPHRWLGMSEPYRVKQLRTRKEWLAMIIFSVAFAMNIGLNNFSLSLLAVSTNLIIRSCLPLVTLVLQLIVGNADGARPKEISLMLGGVFFAALATIAKSHGTHGGPDGKHMVLGVIMCSASDVAAALNLVLASIFGSHMKLNPLDTTFYMAVPAAVCLLPAIFCINHPVEWPGFQQVTDWEVFMKVVELSPITLSLVGISGVLAAGYNLLQYALVQSLSATHAAFAGNFNKAATIMLSIFLGLESLPSGVWSGCMLLAIVGNIASFTGYSLLKEGFEVSRKL